MSITPGGPDVPPWLRIGLLLLFAAMFAGNVVADIFVAGYDGYPESLILAALLGGGWAVDKIGRGR